MTPTDGPTYPALPGAARFRRLAASRNLTPAERDAYGAAVLDGIRALQRSDLAGMLEPMTRPNCASGTAATDGDDILAAIRRSQAAALAARGLVRTPEQLAAAYAEAMAAKRAASVADYATVRPTPIQSPKPPHNQTRKRVRSVNRPAAAPAKPAAARASVPEPIPPAYSLPRITGAVGVAISFGGW